MRAFGSACDRVVGLGLGALVLFAPLAFGSVETWAITIIETVILGLGAVWLAGRLAEGRSAGWLADRRLMIPIAAFVAIVLLQLLPLPRSVLSVVSPRVSSLYERTVPGYAGEPGESFEDWLLATDSARARIGDARPGGSVFAPASYSPSNTRARLLLFVSYAVLFIVAADRYRSQARRRRMIIWTAFTGVGIAILGIFQKLAWSGKILWLRLPPNPRAQPFGPFVNPNHFAGYMELIVPLALGLLLSLILGSREAPWADAGLDPGTPGTGARRFGWLRPEEGEARRRPWTATNRAPKAVLLGFLFALSIGSIVLSLSRGGFLATLLTFVLFAPLLVPRWLRGKGAKNLAGVVALGIALLGAAFWLGSSVVSERAATVASMQTDPSLVGRVDTWARTIGMFRENATLGVGLGAFEAGFAGYYPAGTYGIWKEAHNDYAQLLAEVGLIGMIPVLLALYYFLRLYLVPAITDRTRPERYLDLGLAMGVVSLCLHSFVDFNLQIPAVAVVFVLVGGMLAASSSRSADPVGARPQRRGGALVASLGVVGLACLAVVAGVAGTRRAMGESEVADVVRRVPAPVPEDAYRRLSRLGDDHPRVLAALGDSALSAFDVSSRHGAGPVGPPARQLDMAETAYRRIAAMTPLSAWAWWGLGEVYARRSLMEKEAGTITLEKLIPQGENDLGPKARLALATYRTAILLEPNSYEIHEDLAKLYLQEGMRELGLASYRESGRILPLYYLHEYGPADQLDPDVYRAIAAGIESGLKESALIEPGEVRQTLGNVAYIRGDFAEAERQYRLGLGAGGSRALYTSLVFQVGDALRREGKAAEAVTYLQQATAYENVAWRAWVALAETRTTTGDHCGSFQAWSSAMALIPQDVTDRPRFALEAAREQAACGHVPEAIAQLRQIIASGSGTLEARTLLVHLLRDSGRFHEALEEARSLVTAAPDRREYSDLLDDVERRTAEGVVDAR